MNRIEALKNLEEKLSPIFGSREAQNISKALRLDLAWLCALNPADQLSEDHLAQIDRITQELINAKPIQQITGVAHFYGYRFKVTADVLIPRPETEELVYLAEQAIGSRALRVLEIGVGSGCIGISLKLKCPNIELMALDVSQEALAVAKCNAENLKAEIELRQCDFLNEALWEGLGSFDCIVSNPPYIDISESSEMGPSVLKHEPKVALFTKSNPQVFYQKIHAFAERQLKPKGMIFLELNEFRAKETLEIFQASYEAKIHQDLQGKERMLSSHLK